MGTPALGSLFPQGMACNYDPSASCRAVLGGEAPPSSRAVILHWTRQTAWQEVALMKRSLPTSGQSPASEEKVFSSCLRMLFAFPLRTEQAFFCRSLLQPRDLRSIHLPNKEQIHACLVTWTFLNMQRTQVNILKAIEIPTDSWQCSRCRPKV